MHARATHGLEQGFFFEAFADLAVDAVLMHGVFDGLSEPRLEFGGGPGETIDEQHQIDAVSVVQAVLQLARHAEAVGLQAMLNVRVQVMVGSELNQF